MMEIYIPKFRFEESVSNAVVNNQVEDKIVSALEKLSEYEGEVFGSISGRPLHVWGNSYEGEHFDDCEFQIGKFVRLCRLWWQNTHDKSWSFPNGFVCDQGYPALRCIDENNTEYVMGMHSMFGFEIELVD